jgi:hypothetical protein
VIIFHETIAVIGRVRSTQFTDLGALPEYYMPRRYKSIRRSPGRGGPSYYGFHRARNLYGTNMVLHKQHGESECVSMTSDEYRVVDDFKGF